MISLLLLLFNLCYTLHRGWSTRRSRLAVGAGACIRDLFTDMARRRPHEYRGPQLALLDKKKVNQYHRLHCNVKDVLHCALHLKTSSIFLEG